MVDSSSLISLVNDIQPDEIYNLATQSHVKVSFEMPEYTVNADGIGTLRLLEAIRLLKLEDKTKFYQASTSELYGKVREFPQNENTPFYPRSPYATAKLYAYWITVNYRKGYGVFGSNGIFLITRAHCAAKHSLHVKSLAQSLQLIWAFRIGCVWEI